MDERIDRYVLRLIEQSTPERTAWNIERARQGKPASWNYIDVHAHRAAGNGANPR